MFLQYWMLGVLIILTGLWAEYRNRVGFKSGISTGMRSTLWVLKIMNLFAFFFLWHQLILLIRWLFYPVFL